MANKSPEMTAKLLGLTTAALIQLIVAAIIALVKLFPTLYKVARDLLDAINGELPDISIDEAIARLDAIDPKEWQD
jgi:hypothetical protein